MIPVIPEPLSLKAKSKPDFAPRIPYSNGGESIGEDVASTESPMQFNSLVDSTSLANKRDRPVLKSDSPVANIADEISASIDAPGNELPEAGKNVPTPKELAPLLERAEAMSRKREVSAGAPAELAKADRAIRPMEAPPPRALKSDSGSEQIAVRFRTLPSETPRPGSQSVGQTDIVEVKIASHGEQPAGVILKPAATESKLASPGEQSLRASPIATASNAKPVPSEAQPNPEVQTGEQSLPPDEQRDADKPNGERADASKEHQGSSTPDKANFLAAPLSPTHDRVDQPVSLEQTRIAVGRNLSDRETATRLRADAVKTPKVIGEISPGEGTKTDAPVLTRNATAALPVQSPVESTQPIQPQPASPPTPNAITATGSMPMNLPSPVVEPRVEARIAPQIEQAIDALTEAREAGRVSRPEMVLRHGEFGMVSMRLEAISGDLRATLASRDAGFVPAVQAALAERNVAPSSETSSHLNHQRGQDQSSGAFTGAGGGNSSNYGSSPGSSQGSSQPRLPQQEAARRDAENGDHREARDIAHLGVGTGGLFA